MILLLLLSGGDEFQATANKEYIVFAIFEPISAKIRH